MNNNRTKFLVPVLMVVLVATLLTAVGCPLAPPLLPPLPSLPSPAPTPEPTPAPTPSAPQPSTQPQPAPSTQGSPIDPGWKSPLVGSGVLPSIPTFADIIVTAQKAVVSIQTEGVVSESFLQAIPQRGAGSGVIIDSKGYIITNSHVVEGVAQVKVTLNDGRVFDAIKVNRDPATDLAVIQIEAPNLPVAKLGRSDTLRVGDWVIAIGNALALDGGATVTVGIVSHLKRTIQEQNGVTLYNLLQTDAAINPGNSGGGLFNIAGELVGFNTAIAGEAQNIGFAISLTPSMSVIEQLVQTGRVVRAFLGVSMVNVSSSLVTRYNLGVKEGGLVTAVTRGSPADKAGLQRLDVITIFDGQKITKADQVVEIIRAHKPGDTVQMTYYRGTSEYKTSAALTENPNR